MTVAEDSVSVNGRSVTVRSSAGTTLLEFLRESLGLLGTKEGCSEGECGACTVLVDGQPLHSCIYPALATQGRTVETIEGISKGGDLSSLQAALIAAGGVQCGFCTPGFVMTLTALLRDDPSPDPDQIARAVAGNICRCTGYAQIVEAVAADPPRPGGAR